MAQKELGSWFDQTSRNVDASTLTRALTLELGSDPRCTQVSRLEFSTTLIPIQNKTKNIFCLKMIYRENNLQVENVFGNCFFVYANTLDLLSSRVPPRGKDRD